MMFSWRCFPGFFVVCCCVEASGLGGRGQYDDVLLPSPAQRWGGVGGGGLSAGAASSECAEPPPTPDPSPPRAMRVGGGGKNSHCRRRYPSVDDDGLAGHEARGVAREIGDGAGDLVG